MHKRLDQILSNFGYCSRKQARAFCQEGRVSARGEIKTDVAEKLDPAELLVDGEALAFPHGLLVMMNKPAGYVCSHNPAEGATIYDLLPWQWLARKPVPATVGRLDKDTTGLILITDDTQLNHRLTSPRHKVRKTYEVTLDKPLQTDLSDIFASGELLISGDDKPCLPAEYRQIDDYHAELVLIEGRFHQVKRMFAALDYEVVALHRSQFGQLTLADLPEGEFRAVSASQIEA